MCSNHLFLCSCHGFRKGKCDDINDGHEGTEYVIFGIKVPVPTCPGTLNFLQVLDPSRPEVKTTTRQALLQGTTAVQLKDSDRDSRTERSRRY